MLHSPMLEPPPLLLDLANALAPLEANLQRAIRRATSRHRVQHCDEHQITPLPSVPSLRREHISLTVIDPTHAAQRGTSAARR